MKQIYSFIREQLAFMAVAIFVFSGVPAILPAQEVNPLPFVAPLSVSRGNVTPAYDYATYLTQSDICSIVMQDWGWRDCTGVDAFVAYQFPDIYATLVYAPNSDGFVSFDDWDTDEKTEVIAQIETELRRSLREQGAVLGVPISFDGWVVYPSLNKERGFMYYATSSVWDGDKTVNINATVFDRRGHVKFLIVPDVETLSPAAAEEMILRVLDQYEPRESETYASFSSGDKVAAVGAVGVLAGLAGLKYSKSAGGILVILLLILKKAWFLVSSVWLASMISHSERYFMITSLKAARTNLKMH